MAGCRFVHPAVLVVVGASLLNLLLPRRLRILDLLPRLLTLPSIEFGPFVASLDQRKLFCPRGDVPPYRDLS